MAIDHTTKMFKLTEIMKNMHKDLDNETLDMLNDMDADPDQLKSRLNEAITPDIAEKLKAIDLPPAFDAEQISGFQVEAYIENSLNSDDPAIANAAQELRDTEAEFMDPENRDEIESFSGSGPSGL